MRVGFELRNAALLNPHMIIPNRTRSRPIGTAPRLFQYTTLGYKLSLLIISLFAASVSFGQTPSFSEPGTIHGVVFDQTGKPLSEADVYVITDTRTSRWECVSAVSDAEGSFVLQGVPPGSYYIYAHKNSAGYPDDFYAFFSTDPPRPWVKVEAENTTEVVIQKGPSSASLELSVTDENGMPKTDYTLQFNRVDLGKIGVFGTTPDFPHGAKDPPMRADWPHGLKPLPILVPPVPFRLTVNADGYEPWHYGGKNWAGKSGLITLKSGQNLTLAVRLCKKK